MEIISNLRKLGNRWFTQGKRWKTHSNSTIPVWFMSQTALPFSLNAVHVQWKDERGWTLSLVIFSPLFFHASDPSENVPVHHSWACGASEGGIKEGEIMRAHTACKEFRHSHSVGALPLETPTVVFLQRLHPNNRDTPSSDHRLAIRRRELWSHFSSLLGALRQKTAVCRKTSKSRAEHSALVKSHRFHLLLSGST